MSRNDPIETDSALFERTYPRKKARRWQVVLLSCFFPAAPSDTASIVHRSIPIDSINFPRVLVVVKVIRFCFVFEILSLTMMQTNFLVTSFLALGAGNPWTAQAFVLPAISTDRTTSTALSSTRSSPYSTVDVSGPRWNGEFWENRRPSHYEQFARNRAGLGNAPTSSTPTNTLDDRTTNNFVPPAPPAPPLVRYSTLPEEAKADIADPAGRSRNRVGPYYYSPPPPSIRLPENSQEISGGSRGTWSSDGTLQHDTVQVTMTTDGRPLNADLEVYQGPDNTPQKMRIYTEDGRLRPFTTMIQTPQGAAANAHVATSFSSRSLRDNFSSSAVAAINNAGASHSISIKNIGPLEFPIIAGVEGKGPTPDEERAASMADYSGRSMGSFLGRSQEIHGGHLKTFPFDPSVASVEVKIHSQGLPIMAIVELWQGPGDVKTVAQIYCDDGQNKPFSAIIETPGPGNTIAIRNMGPTAYPIEAELDVHSVDNSAYSYSYPRSTYENSYFGGY